MTNDNKNYPVYARIFNGYLCAVRSDDTSSDPHRIYLYDDNLAVEGKELEPTEYQAYLIKDGEVIE